MRRSSPNGSSEHPVTQRSVQGLELVIVSSNGRGRVLPVLPRPFTLGSDRGCDVVLNLPGVLPRHAHGKRTEDGALCVRGVQPDSVFVNDASAAEWTSLGPGDFLRLGEVELVLRERGDADSPSGTLRAQTRQRSEQGQPTILTEPPAPDPGFDPTLAPKDRPRQPTIPVAPEPGAADLQPDTVIADRYRIIGKIAAGGMGEVYKAEHIELARVFALKVMRPQLSNDPRFVERFKREAGTAGRIGHKNIVDITDFGRTADGRFYYVMEFLDGRTLASIIGDEGPQPMPRLLHLALQMVQALGAAHRLGITHRDLKPENVMVLQRDNQADLVKIVDFGVAKESSPARGAGHTAIGTLIGTPQYMAPEQAAGLDVDALQRHLLARSDLLRAHHGPRRFRG